MDNVNKKYHEENFTNTEITKATFINCRFYKCIFDFSEIMNTTFINCRFHGSFFVNTIFDQTNFTKCYWKKCNLNYCRFDKTEWVDCTIYHSVAQEWLLQNSRLTKCTFLRTSWENSHFLDSTVNNIKFDAKEKNPIFMDVIQNDVLQIQRYRMLYVVCIMSFLIGWLCYHF